MGFHKILEEANAGDQMGLLARGIKSQDVTRGMCVVKPKSVKAADHFVAQVYLMTPDEGGRKKPCTKDMQLICFSKTWDCASYVELEGKVTDIKDNLTDEERMLMQMNKEKRAKYLAKK